MSSGRSRLNDKIYLDHHSTTPCDPRVSKLVRNVSEINFGNPSSSHGFGKAARRLVESARSDIAEHIGALPGEITFTSGATESNNLVLLGLLRGLRENGVARTKILTTAIEHKSVLRAAELSARQCHYNYEVIPATEHGVIDISAAESLIDADTVIVSCQYVNNELGTVQPVERVAKLARDNGALFHCDGAQALGRMRINVQELNADFMSFSAHKAYGPKGVGVLYSAGGVASYPFRPLIVGGGHESGVRSGTLNVPGVVGLAKAARIIDAELQSERARENSLRNMLEDGILDSVAGATVTVPRHLRVASTSCLRFPGAEAEAILARLPHVAVSTGSACESGAPGPSHVLEAIGLSRSEAGECLRAAVGRFTTEDEIGRAIEQIAHAACGVAAAMSA